ncbi:tetratricopeptide repeat protein [Chitinophaga sp. SYP-B3965]|uniref:tetratricopeptide repeat protein n=1 Tax=Chitinophaga sp. SYP-B3965 TaxID=2663120 RepID=UPI00129973B1|nr:tetratricopeptide repeat protein [Chitinophaga sp. SYP-B3965]MRG44933.1 tetratricopeptide repeat protein [Chitinophaga sp. SYP-B3965]
MLRTIVWSAFFACVFSSCKVNTSYVISKEEAQATAKEMEVVIQQGSAEGLAAFFDMPSLFNVLAKKIRDPKVMERTRAEYSIMPTMKVAMKSSEGGSGKLVRNYEKNGHRHLVFRFLNTGGITYMDFHLIKVGNVVKIEDMLGFETGEELTTALADGLNTIGVEDENVKQSRLIKEMEGRRDNLGIKELFEQLPVAQQQHKWMLMPYVNACWNIGRPEDYKVAVEKWVKVNPYGYLRMIGACIALKDYEQALLAVDKVNERIGGEGDPYLDYYKGAIHWQMGNHAAAKPFYEKVAAYDPDLLDNLSALIAIYVQDQEIDKAKKLIAGYRASKVFSQEGWSLLQKSFPVLFH